MAFSCPVLYTSPSYEESERLKRELESKSQSAEGTRERLESLCQLFDLMGSVEGNERTDLRLRLRQELRKLISLSNGLTFTQGAVQYLRPNMRKRPGVIWRRFARIVPRIMCGSRNTRGKE